MLLFAFEVPTGVVADRFGRKISLFLGTVVFGLCFLAYAFTRSYPVLVAIQFPCAAAFSLISGADHALMYETARAADTDPVTVTAKMARYNAFGSAGMFAAFPLGSLFAASGLVPYISALGVTFAASGTALILAGFIVLRVHEAGRPELKEHPLKTGVRGFTTLFKTAALARLSVNTALVAGITFMMFWLYQAILIGTRFPAGAVGFISAAFNGLGALVLFRMDAIRKRVPAGALLAITSAITGVLYLAAGLFPVLPLALAAIFGITLMRFMREPVTTTLINDAIDSDIRATVLSGLSMLERIVITVLYFAVGFLCDRSVPQAFIVLGLLCLGVTLLAPVQKTPARSVTY